MDSKASNYDRACEEAIKQNEIKQADNGNCCYNSVKMENTEQMVVGWLTPLRVTFKSNLPVKIELCDSDSFTIGRGSQCNFQLDQNMFEEEEENIQHNKTSRVHILIAQESGELVLYDKSENGTYVNGTKVEKKILSTGDRIGVLREDFNIFDFNECAP